MQLSIQIDDPCSLEITKLLQTHLELMAKNTPGNSGHALRLDALNSPEITLWSAKIDNILLGCVALKQLSNTHGEIKSMHIAEKYRNHGVARALLTHIIKESKQRGYKKLSLETGTSEAFAPSRSLYKKFGFEHCEPFGNYINDPFSYCMTRSV